MCYLCIPFFKANQVKIMTEIVYMTQGNVEMPRLNETAVRDWIIEVAGRHGQKVGCLTYVFCDDAYILATNREFLGHD
jgi:ssRNA-specific RNase YbeY (16S rRNA maturation enzyme)